MRQLKIYFEDKIGGLLAPFTFINPEELEGSKIILDRFQDSWTLLRKRAISLLEEKNPFGVENETVLTNLRDFLKKISDKEDFSAVKDLDFASKLLTEYSVVSDLILEEME